MHKHARIIVLPMEVFMVQFLPSRMEHQYEKLMSNIQYVQT